MVNRRIASALTVLVALTALSLIPGSAFGYSEGNVRTQCVDCHGSVSQPPSESTADTATVTGPHRGYSSTSRKCQTCHQVHVAASENLLPAATIVATCNVCHDGSGGGGVYGVLLARGITPDPNGMHRVETGATNVVPGGDPDTGLSATMTTLRGPGGMLTCTDCHTPHGQNVVAPFTGDRKRVASPISPNPKSSRLLSRDPGGTGKDIADYGSSWCLACHAGRATMNTPLKSNHPVATDTVAVYDSLIRMASDTMTGTTEIGSLGGSNRGYLMTTATLATLGAAGSGPICQQCHEDARNVDVVGAVGVGQLNALGTQADPATFTVTALDGWSETDNPRFQVFPHESVTPHFLVEENDHLCYGNCHKI
ncbi:MAG: cytochrome c3 family protein [Coriobacteriia bacterium]|nr:cytochrome c3 family protein [Coriobacteriia bacterium]